MTSTRETRLIRWGIIGTGNIAHQFARGLAAVPDAALVAVCSRKQETAEAFGRAFGARHVHWNPDALAENPEVDVVYIATPNATHARESLRFLTAGKAVLCEKPFACNAREAEEMVATARHRGVFLMEAMWTRFLPAMAEIVDLARSERIGPIQCLMADFGIRAPFNPAGRLFDPALGGGALLDLGSYCVSFASHLFGTADRIAGLAHIGPTGVDERNGLVLLNEDGGMAVFLVAITAETPQQAVLVGSRGHITIHAPWWRPRGFTVTGTAAPPKAFEVPYNGNGYGHQAAEVGRCLRAGETESRVLPLSESLSIMRTLDRLRADGAAR